MKKFLLSSACVLALACAPLALDAGQAEAGNNLGNAILGGIAAGVAVGIIANAVAAGQQHCHQGLGCHVHGGAGAYHYHDAYGNILYQQAAVIAPQRPVIVQPVQPVYGGALPPEHYNWCLAKYRSYDPNTNTYQPYNVVGRAYCRSPYGG